MARLESYLPSPGSAVWRRDVGSPPPAQQLHQDSSSVLRGGTAIASPSESSRVRHVVIRDAEIWEEPAPYVVRSLSRFGGVCCALPDTPTSLKLKCYMGSIIYAWQRKFKAPWVLVLASGGIV